MRSVNWMGKSLSLGLILAFGVGGLRAQSPRGTTKPAATVNGEAITMAEVESVLKLRPPMPTPPTDMQRRQMQLEILGMLIDDVLMQQFLRQNGSRIDLAEVNRRIHELEASLKEEGKTLDDFYRTTGQNEAQVRNKIVTMLQWSAFAKKQISDEALKHYYEENKDYFDQVNVQASHIVLRLPPNGSEGDRQAARAKLMALRQDLVKGKIDFAEAAKKFSQCPTAPNGGDVGPFTRKFAVEESFAKAAFALRVGEISNVVETDYGLHLIKVTGRKAEGPPSTFEKVKEEVRETAGQELWQAVLAQVRKDAKIEVNIAGR